MKNRFFFGLIALFSLTTIGRAQESRPNILLITIDDLNDWIGCLGGHPQARTPNMDRLAERGVLFTNAHCNAPICGPSRTSLMTGMRPSTTGCYDNNHVFSASRMAKHDLLLPRHFSANGYETVGCGKLFHGSKGTQYFQRYGPALGQGPLPETRFNVTDEGSKTKLWDWGEYPAKTEDTHDFESAEFAETELAAKHNKPLFLGVGFYRPHVPMYAPPEWFKNYPIDEVQLPPTLENDLADVPPAAIELIRGDSVAPTHAWIVEKDKWAGAVQAYLASVEFMDHCFGKVIDALDAGPNADNTWIFVTGDHGWHLGEKETWAKRTLWERSTRVPMMIIPPKNAGSNFEQGKRCDAPVEMLSFFPTMTELAGINKQPKAEGHSLVPLLKNVATEWKFPAITTFMKNNHTIRTVDWRYTRYADGEEELFDRKADPNEWKNLAGDPAQSETIATLAKFLPSENAEPVRPIKRVKRPKK